MTHLGKKGARIDNMYDINFESVIGIIQHVFPTNPHSMVSISGRNLAYWLLEDDVSTWSTPQIHTSAYSLPHFDTLEHTTDDIFARHVNHNSTKLTFEAEIYILMNRTVNYQSVVSISGRNIVKLRT